MVCTVESAAFDVTFLRLFTQKQRKEAFAGEAQHKVPRECRSTGVSSVSCSCPVGVRIEVL